MKRAHALAIALFLTACAEDAAVDSERVRALEQQARAIASTDGCDRVDQCAIAPLGAKACGGPRDYLVYCKAMTDEAALNRALEELKRAEEDYNRTAGIISDCAITRQPDVRLNGRTCTAAQP
jgi:hypothetical protein